MKQLDLFRQKFKHDNDHLQSIWAMFGRPFEIRGIKRVSLGQKMLVSVYVELKSLISLLEV